MTLSYEQKVKAFLKENGVDGRARVIYRIEDDDGNGPYMYSVPEEKEAYIDIAGDANSDMPTNRRPTPCSEPNIGYISDREYRFGFNDFQQVHSWFNKKERAALRRAGCSLWVYRTKAGKHLKVGQAQIVFKKRYAKRIGKIDI